MNEAMDFHTRFLKFPFKYSFEHENLTFESDDALAGLLKENSVTFKNSGSKVIVEMSALPFRYCHSLDEFNSKINHENYKDKSIVLRVNEHFIFINSKDFTVVNLAGEDSENEKIISALYFLELYEFLVEECKSENEHSNLVDYFDAFNQELVFVLSKTNYRLKVPITSKIPLELLWSSRKSIARILKDNLNENKRAYRLFLKAQILKGIEGVPANLRVSTLFNKLSSFIQKAQVDYDVYISDLSIDDIKARYQDFRSQFFAETSNIVKSISAYVIGLPLSALGGGYAIYKTQGSIALLLLICLSLIAATSITISILIHFSKDLRSIYQTAHADYNILISNKFFENHDSEKAMFEAINTRLNEKILSTYNVIIAQFWTLGVIISALLAFSVANQKFYAISISFPIIILISLLLGVFGLSQLIVDPFKTSDPDAKEITMSKS